MTMIWASARTDDPRCPPPGTAEARFHARRPAAQRFRSFFTREFPCDLAWKPQDHRRAAWRAVWAAAAQSAPTGLAAPGAVPSRVVGLTPALAVEHPSKRPLIPTADAALPGRRCCVSAGWWKSRRTPSTSGCFRRSWRADPAHRLLNICQHDRLPDLDRRKDRTRGDDGGFGSCGRARHGRRCLVLTSPGVGGLVRRRRPAPSGCRFPEEDAGSFGAGGISTHHLGANRLFLH